MFFIETRTVYWESYTNLESLFKVFEMQHVGSKKVSAVFWQFQEKYVYSKLCKEKRELDHTEYSPKFAH